MRKIIPLNHNWQFTKTPHADLAGEGARWQSVSLPHTWNAADGAEGGSYYRGECCYRTRLNPAALLAGTPWAGWERTDEEGAAPGSLLFFHAFLRVHALALRGNVYVNGEESGSHEGGYSAFTVDITRQFREALAEDAELTLIISADNSIHSHLYPQTADFTCYGGLYRGVELLLLPEVHFDASYHGAGGLAVTCELPESPDYALLHLNSWVNTDAADYAVRYQVVDRDGGIAAECWRPAAAPKADILLPAPHLWQGVDDPYLYRLTATLVYRNEQVDHVSSTFGIREFYVDAEKGFFLNGKSMMLRGVSRHQDWLGEGYALTREQHFRDAKLIAEMGANTVRAGRYQHSEDFYDACDELGFIVWAEIPYMGRQSDDRAAFDNVCEQMKDLICQNYNHPSICFLGLSDKITLGGENADIERDHRALHQLVKELDPSRLTAMAHTGMLPVDSPLHGIADVEGYDYSLGPCGDRFDYIENRLDEFHELHPDICLSLSGYGAEGFLNRSFGAKGVPSGSFGAAGVSSGCFDMSGCGDLSEERQAQYHEHMVGMLMERPYLWSAYVENMFDYGCGEGCDGSGRNCSGLVTMDRQIPKDAFYIYKAYWSKEPFVRICGRRCAERAADSTDIKVYSNQPQVSLYVNGELFSTQVGSRIFVFEDVPLEEGFTYITATASDCSDTITLEQVEEEPSAGAGPSASGAAPFAGGAAPFAEDGTPTAANWFAAIETVASDAPVEFSETHFSVCDTLGDLLAHEETCRVLTGAIPAMSGIPFNRFMLTMMRDKTFVELAETFAAMGGSPSSGIGVSGNGSTVPKAGPPANALQIVNAELNKIRKNP
ncbi:MAG: glycoside hydrolase family 2 protein [Clostridium sp.]|nr:glycoside hydrolase family 2 protein [Acetatifactor muris]MCM1527570.1 glycoside hydrolase family 2 protein [Bacteroides sp.]MCM1563812.1 glycoside hydrolase family 2 protein [Clostridium sp.]